MSSINDHLDCCGINEIIYIDGNKNKPEITIIEVCEEIYVQGKEGAYLIFSDVGNKRIAGNNLKNFIIDKNLGEITETPPAINPNTKHHLQMWVWKINKRNLRNYYLKHTND